MAEQVSAKLAVSSGAGNGTKGAYVEALATTSFKCNWLEIVLIPVGTISTKCNVDVAVGAAASEVDKIIEFPFVVNSGSSGDNQTGYRKISVAFEFESGVRLAVRCCDTSGSAIDYLIQLRIISFT